MTVIYDMPDGEYHSRPELSSTGVRQLLDSPQKFRYWSDHPQPAKHAFDVGTATHTKVLGIGSGTVEYPPEHLTPSGSVSTKAATVEWENEQRALGFTPIGPVDAARVNGMAEAVLADPDARRVLESLVGREVTVVSDVDGVPSRARFDLFDGDAAGDLKTARDASPKGFNTSVGRFGYHIQEQWYRDTLKASTGVELASFKFVVVESSAPYSVGSTTSTSCGKRSRGNAPAAHVNCGCGARKRTRGPGMGRRHSHRPHGLCTRTRKRRSRSDGHFRDARPKV